MKATAKWTTGNFRFALRATSIVLLCSFVTLNAQSQEPLWSDDPAALGYFADLLRLGGFGFTHWEAAAFLLRSTDGGYRCLAWPFSNGHHEQKFRGRMPDFTVAIVHTHPQHLALPSPGDRATAKRLGIPVIVLTSRNIYVAAPDGSIVEVVEDRAWLDAARDSDTWCETPRGRTVHVAGVREPRSGRPFVRSERVRDDGHEVNASAFSQLSWKSASAH
jgi:hypothetical protein